jgi:CheY-like chemotaxis protein
MARILVVDDDPDNREIVREVLEGAGHEVVTVGSAEEALEQLDRKEFDVVLSDIDLPGMSGIALAKELATRVQAPGVIHMSGRDHRRASQESGAEHFLAKPFSPKRLLAVL